RAVCWAGRATLVHRPEDVPVYDRAFGVFWRQVTGDAPSEPAPVPVTLELDDERGNAAGPAGEPPGPTIAVRYSAVEVLRQKDFAAYSHEEFDEARRLMADLRLAGAMRRSRRLRAAAGRGSRPDLRRTAQRALRAGGEPIQQAFL